MTPDLTIRQKILMAAADLAARGDGSFDTDALARRAHALHPESFSLGGEGPPMADNNKVLAKLAGVDGLVGLGWLEAEGRRTYRVTRAGARVAAGLAALVAPVAEPPRAPEPEAAPDPRRVAKLRNSATATAAAVAEPRRAPEPEAPPSPRPKPQPPAPVERARPQPQPRPATLTDEDRARVRRYAGCNALRKFLRGSPIAFADACEFWGADPRRFDRALLDAAEDVLRRAVEGLGAEGVVDAALPPLSTCYGLLNLHRLMVSRFAREVAAAAEARRG